MELNAADIFLTLFILLYTLILIVFSIGLLFYVPARATNKKVFLSVLIAARNEEARISDCIRSLLKQNYDREFFEVIVINDRSTDRTASIVESFQKEFANLRLLTITETPSTMAPKKHALNEGINTAKGEIIVCTDADCRPEENWLASMISGFSDEVGMVVGYSPIEPKKRFSLLENFTALDSLSLASLAAASSAYGMTLTATGRSLAYRKTVFNEVGGFSKIAHFISGDDDLLLGLVKKTRWRIAYAIGEKALVYTDPPETIRKFINQKIRQASKGRHYSVKMIAGLSLFYIFDLLLITYVPVMFFSAADLPQRYFYLSFWIIKLAADLLTLAVGAWRFNKARYLLFYPLISVIHPFYIVVFGAWGLFGKFEWKDSSSKTKYQSL